MLVARFFGRLSFFSVALSLAMIPKAHASAPVSLRWSAPADCPSGNEVLEEVERLLGARTAANESVLDVVAEVKRKDDGTFTVRLEIPGADGPRVREVSAASCSALGSATALILAMMIDPEAAMAAPPKEPSDPPQKSPLSNPDGPGKTNPEPKIAHFDPNALAPFIPVPRRPELPNSSIVLPPQKSSPTKRPQFSVGLSALVDFGSLPSSSGGIGGTIGVLPGRFRFQGGAAYLLEKTANFPKMRQAGALVNFWALHLSGGYAIPLFSTLEFVPRLRVELGRFSATSFGVTKVDEAATFSLGLGAGGLLSVGINSYFRLGLSFDALGLVSHPRFIVTGLGTAHEPSLFVGRLAFGAEVRF